MSTLTCRALAAAPRNGGQQSRRPPHNRAKVATRSAPDSVLAGSGAVSAGQQGEASGPPLIKVQVDTPSGSCQFSTESGSDVLRSALLEQKANLYDTWGKIMNCGGGGNCGTCVVQVLDGSELLSARTSAENRKLKGRPDSLRLACQVVVGDGANAGVLRVKTQPKS